MVDALISGERLAIVRAPGCNPRGVGAVVRVDGGALIGLKLDTLYGEPVVLERDEPLQLARASGSDRLVATASHRCSASGLTWLALDEGGWRSLNQRTSPRVDVTQTCSVAPSGQPGIRRRGHLLNISAGGSRISLPEHIDAARLDLYLPDGSDEIAVHCAVLAVEHIESHVELRLRFERMTLDQERAVARVIDSAAAAGDERAAA